jgi:hypothetical protein
MGSDANASLYMTKYVNVNISIQIIRFLTFDFALDLWSHELDSNLNNKFTF